MGEVGHALALAIATGIAALAAFSPARHGVVTEDPATETPREDPSAKATPTRPAPLVPPPPRAPVAGLRGFESRSRLDYPSQPGRVHELRAVSVFPERVRWWMGAPDGAITQRRLRYQYGQHVLSFEPPSTDSVEFRDEDRDALLASFEMRRALFLWPDDRTWSAQGDMRVAAFANGDELRAKVAGDPLRPTTLEYVVGGRDVRESIRAITWSAASPRAWPATFEVWNGKTLAWSEVVESVDVETRYVDSFFVPPDRRGVAGTPVAEVRDLDIPPTCLRRIELATGTTWAAAVAERARLAADARERKLPELEEWLTFEVRDDGSPAAVILRLARIPKAAPEGFVMVPERIGIARPVKGLDAVGAALLKSLAARLPAGAQPGRTYVRFDGRRSAGDAGDVIVVVPVD